MSKKNFHQPPAIPQEERLKNQIGWLKALYNFKKRDRHGEETETARTILIVDIEKLGTRTFLGFGGIFGLCGY